MSEEGFYRRHRMAIQGIISVAVGALLAAIGFLAITAGNTAEQVKKDVRVLKQASPCLAAKESPTPKNLALCHKSFGQAVALVTSPQACLLFLKGASLLVIDGQRVRSVKCLTLEGKPVTAAGLPSPFSTQPEDQTKSETRSTEGSGGTQLGNSGGSKGSHSGQQGGGGDKGSGGGTGGGSTGGDSTGGGTAQTGEDTSDSGKAAIGLEVLSEDGPVLGAEVLPDVVPVKSCKDKLLNLNC